MRNEKEVEGKGGEHRQGTQRGERETPTQGTLPK